MQNSTDTENHQTKEEKIGTIELDKIFKFMNNPSYESNIWHNILSFLFGERKTSKFRMNIILAKEPR